MTIISVTYFVSFYILLRQIFYFKSAYEELYTAIQFRGPLLAMLIACPQVYLLMILTACLHFSKAGRDAVKPLMRIWVKIFVLGSAWTTLFIYMINNG